MCEALAARDPSREAQGAGGADAEGSSEDAVEDPEDVGARGGYPAAP